MNRWWRWWRRRTRFRWRWWQHERWVEWVESRMCNKRTHMHTYGLSLRMHVMANVIIYFIFVVAPFRKRRTKKAKCVSAKRTNEWERDGVEKACGKVNVMDNGDTENKTHKYYFIRPTMAVTYITGLFASCCVCVCVCEKGRFRMCAFGYVNNRNWEDLL